MPGERFSIAQVTPYAWEQHHEANRFVERLSDELCARGHRVVVIAPSDSRELVRESRATIKGLAEDPDAVFAGEGCVQVLGVGHSLSLQPPGRGGGASLPVDVSRTIETLLETTPFDFVHVHDPFAPSISSVALRHSWALNVGTFHAASEPALSRQVARRFTRFVLGRLDGRTASYAATRELVGRFFPGEYPVIRPGSDLAGDPTDVIDGPLGDGRPPGHEGAAGDAPAPGYDRWAGDVRTPGYDRRAGDDETQEDDRSPEILLSAEEERAAVRLFLRALRR
ncbi:MAG: glycosyltransferase family 4 protein, partial [Actinomycetota bacterium]|nr:glycosyltransferase family 4 protein [Actinomycetota bacterium]